MQRSKGSISNGHSAVGNDVIKSSTNEALALTSGWYSLLTGPTINLCASVFATATVATLATVKYGSSN